MPEEESSFRRKVQRSFIWLSTGTFSGQLISWVSTIFVIRILLPSDYGLMAMAVTFVTVLRTISELGINASIIQAERINEKEIRQIYGVLILGNILGFFLSQMMAPMIASFFNNDRVVTLIRVLSINFIIITLYVIPESLLIREMNFKKKAQVDVLAQVGASILTLILALKGMGVWALAAGEMSLHLIKAVAFNLGQSLLWRPIFRFRGAEKFIKFGLSVIGTRLLYAFNMQADKIIIGKFLGNDLLGIYSVALNLASIPLDKVLPIITQVTYTAYSRIQKDIERIRNNILNTTRIVAFLGFPLFFGMAGVAPEAIPLLLGPKWEAAVVPFQLICLILPLKGLSPILPPAVFAVGKAKVILVNTAITFVLMTIFLLAGVKGGLFGVCIAWISGYPIAFFLTNLRCLNVLNLPLRNYLSEIRYPFVASGFMLICLMVIRNIFVTFRPLPTLMILVSCGVVFYLSVTMIFRKGEYSRLTSLLHK